MDGAGTTQRQRTARWQHDDDGGQRRREHDGDVDAADNGDYKSQHGIKRLKVDHQLN
jgi:hypothetical protein